MSEKQLLLLRRYLSNEYIEQLENMGIQTISDFIGMIIVLKQPNRWKDWLIDRVSLEEYDPLNIKYYEVLMDIEIFDIFTFMKFLVEDGK